MNIRTSRLAWLLLFVLAAAVALVVAPSQKSDESIRRPPPVCGPFCVGGGVGVGGR